MGSRRQSRPIEVYDMDLRFAVVFAVIGLALVQGMPVGPDEPAPPSEPAAPDMPAPDYGPIMDMTAPPPEYFVWDTVAPPIMTPPPMTMPPPPLPPMAP